MGLEKGGIGYVRMLVKGVIPEDFAEVYGEALQAHAFTEIDPSTEQQESAGWVRWHDALDTDFPSGPDTLPGDVVLLRMRVDQLKVPTVTLKAHVQHRIRYLRTQQGRPKLTRAETQMVTAEVKRGLRHDSLAKMGLTEAQWSMATGEIRLFGTSRRTMALFIDLFEKTFALKLDPMGPRNLLMMRGMTDEHLAALEQSEPDPLHLRSNAPPPLASSDSDTPTHEEQP